MTHSNLLLVGCGKMGGALLSGWLRDGWPASAVCVVDSHPPTREAWRARGVNAVAEAAEVPERFAPDAVLIAVKPQGLADALPAVAARLAALPRTPLIVSIVAGKPVAAFTAAFGAETPVLRVMPNTPAAVGRGISGLYANPHVAPEQKALGETLMRAVGEAVWVDDEEALHAVTALSGSGPAYVFHLVEAMARAGRGLGLDAETAMRLARATVTGAGELLHQSPETAEALRVNVTSPGGTTAAALAVLMDETRGFPPLLDAALAAAARRSRELAG